MTRGRTFLLWLTVIPLVVAALLVGGFAWVAAPSFPVRDGVVYAAEDPAAGGWVLATVSEDGDLSECSVPDAALGASRSDGARTLLLPRAGGAPRPLVLHPVADAWTRTRNIGLPLFGRAACRQRMVTHLRWTASRGPGPWDALWSAREQAMTVRLAQGDPDEQPPYTWTTWISDLRWDELSSWDEAPYLAPYDESEEDRLVALGPSWLVLKHLSYVNFGGAHGTSHSTFSLWVEDHGHPRQMPVATLFGGSIPWKALVPALHRAYARAFTVPGEPLPPVTDAALMRGAPWPRYDGLVVSYQPYAIGPYSAGDPDLVIPLHEIQPLLDPRGPGRRFWPAVAPHR